LESRWFIGIDDYWPREIHHRSFQLGKQEITETIVLMNIKTDVAYAPSDFSADVPEGYSVKIYQGFGKTAPALKPGDASPDWTLKDLKGASHQLGDFVGKIVVLDFWATWCLPCLKAMECIEKLHTSFAKKGVVFLGVNIWEKGDPARFVKEKGFTYQIIQNGDDVAKDYGVAAMGIPTIYVIGPDGKILFGESGFTADTCPALERVIKEALIKAQR
jgi:peroxiredoxin